MKFHQPRRLLVDAVVMAVISVPVGICSIVEVNVAVWVVVLKSVSRSRVMVLVLRAVKIIVSVV